MIGSMKKLFALVLAMLLAACVPQKFNSADITGANYARDFQLADAQGQPRTLADFRGKVVLIFFGYAQCPDVCPTTLSDMAEIKRRLGPAGEKLQVIFVTVDPARDTAEVLGQYVPAFDKSFVGLRGTPEQTEAVAREFKIFYRQVPGATPSSYTIDHTAGSYVFDREGRVRLFLRHKQDIDSVVADLKRLLS